MCGEQPLTLRRHANSAAASFTDSQRCSVCPWFRGLVSFDDGDEDRDCVNAIVLPFVEVVYVGGDEEPLGLKASFLAEFAEGGLPRGFSRLDLARDGAPASGVLAIRRATEGDVLPTLDGVARDVAVHHTNDGRRGHEATTRMTGAPVMRRSPARPAISTQR